MWRNPIALLFSCVLALAPLTVYAAQPLASPYSYFADSNGAPLAGGKVYTYVAGTTTPKNSYTDSTGVTPASNPVILDSAGRATIWLSGSYKIVVKDSSGNTISTTDNVTFGTTTGDMNSSVYDPANVLEQLVGLTASQTLTNKTLTKPVVTGTTTNDSAASGERGEYKSSNVGSGSAVSLTTGTSANITSLSLGAGDWDVEGVADYTGNSSTTVQYMNASLSTTSATQDSSTDRLGSVGYHSNAAFSDANPFVVRVGRARFSFASTTTVYLVANAGFGVSTCSVYGILRARRVW